jgi:hypothetical protein
MESEDAEMASDVTEMVEEKAKEPDFTVLMRTLKHLTRSGKLEAGSGKHVCVCVFVCESCDHSFHNGVHCILPTTHTSHYSQPYYPPSTI